MNYAEINLEHQQRAKKLRDQEQAERDELKEQYQRGLRDIDERYTQERSRLAVDIAALWETYQQEKSDPLESAQRTVERQRLRRQLAAPDKIKIKHNVKANSVDDMIVELKDRIADKLRNDNRADTTNLEKAIRELGGTPDPFTHRDNSWDAAPVSMLPDDDEMNDILNAGGNNTPLK